MVDDEHQFVQLSRLPILHAIVIEPAARVPRLPPGVHTPTDGALSKREKALIALALSHSKQCPYCIDAYTTACLEAGANPDQMTEAVHVAAAMDAGSTLVHSVQMHNHLDELGA